MNKIEHIGIAIKNAEVSVPLFNKLYNTIPYKTELVESEHVKTIFYQVGPNKMELLEATSPESTIAKFIEKRGEGVHHIAYAVDDILAEMHRLESLGFQLLNKEPLPGADNKLICFLHPKTTNGVLVELCMDKPI